MKESQIVGLLSPVLARYGLDLDAVEVLPAGKRRLLRVVVDGDGPAGTGPLLDDIAEATRAISVALDESPAVGSSPYTLEVTSRGVSRPLQLPRHWRRNVGRLVAVTTTSGETFTGRVITAGEEVVSLDVEGSTRDLALSEVAKALVQVELNRPRAQAADDDDDDEADDLDTPTEAEDDDLGAGDDDTDQNEIEDDD
ncbi:MAG: Bacterial ribosome SSU maturation protein RimP [uncultured Friedmanniella sp.]|uniref:Ribosome maturation factor RimP n=1 Tax=uncultured Friedmanniella sp. TaxID=335381 RepID=A0A6J4K1Q0_9ACTN|nr:MAG: Bacterial ribosome SSU maturation protein RimP [uncultured Friedmanniella sp.]